MLNKLEDRRVVIAGGTQGIKSENIETDLGFSKEVKFFKAIPLLFVKTQAVLDLCVKFWQRL